MSEIDDYIEEEEVDYTDLQSVLKAEMTDAADFTDQIGEDRAESTEYYLGNEPAATSDLQSEYVDTSLRDTVLFMMPSIMRTFFGGKKIVEFVPKNSEDIPIAEQQTDYVNYIVQEVNPGFKIFYDAFKDALVRKAGFVKAYYENKTVVTHHKYENLSAEATELIIGDDDVEVLEKEDIMEAQTVIDPQTGEDITQEKPTRHNLKIKRSVTSDKICLESIPPEEILLSRNARSIENAEYVAHRRMVSISDLVAMGYDREEVELHAGSMDDDPTTYNERQARNPFDDVDNVDRVDDDTVYYIEHFLFYDLDDDDIAERIKVCTIGNACHVVNVEAVGELPIVMFQPDPEPHTVVGSCPADYLKGIQAAKSQIVRDTLDSLGHSIFPRYEVVTGNANMDDVLSTDIGQPIRVTTPGSVRPLTTPFVGKEAFSVLSYLDAERENRTGISKASAGLNADALQSSSAAAVSATISAAQGRTELICRHFAEGMKRLFKVVNSLVIRYADSEDIFRLNNSFVQVDPRVWDMNKDVTVNVAISKNSDAEKGLVLREVLGIQKEAMQQLGAKNPLVTPQQFANTIAKLIELGGFKDAQTFINTTIEMPPEQPEPEKPDPQAELAKAEMRKAEATADKALIDAQNDRLKIIMEDDFKRDKAQADAAIKLMELNAKYGTTLDKAIIDAYLERDKEVIRQNAKGINGAYDVGIQSNIQPEQE